MLTSEPDRTDAVGGRPKAGFAYSHRHDDVEIVVMNRPEKLNAWTEAMRDDLAEILVRARDDDSVGAIVLTGSGRGFCAGQDLAETRTFAAADPARAEAWLRRIAAFYDVIRETDKPTVAAINGVAAGSGFQVTLLMDVRVAHATAMLGQPEVSSGIPSITGTYLMAQALGLSRTTELVLSGRLMSADEAHAAGVVHDVVTTGDVVDVAILRAQRLARQPAGAVARTKAWLRAMTERSYRDAFTHALHAHRDAYASGEPQREMSRFLETRATAPAADVTEGR
ncbi:Enoyl-CoA hydratase/carnithine racemase [Actinomadura madurae]|uniref:Enoyl-CoA hydratase/carnithine racemase n=1 Tax=Actinomadura madurae TaxID=1993 RepID=A0A1I5M9N9_9ACTN|nr:enoyl-CoA hydratase/isomerase family protein [Actinomadura madurae]SFP06027.1 Enoyl-CoA hydratase/carnithine racemase [Actinomadura madurae]